MMLILLFKYFLLLSLAGIELLAEQEFKPNIEHNDDIDIFDNLLEDILDEDGILLHSTNIVGSPFRSTEKQVVVNDIYGRKFEETYPTRCMKSTKLQLREEEEPKMIFLQSGGRENDITLEFSCSTQQIHRANFDPSKPTIVFVHGWTQSAKSEYLKRTRRLIEQTNAVRHANYLKFDWHLAARDTYRRVAAKTSGIGNYLALWLERLIDLGADRDNIHLIGHSIGTHVAGFAGRRIRPPIGRITALDAAGPCFGPVMLNGPDDRLSSGDAKLVVNYHYDELAGNPEATGDIDIYVNGGKHQPGCATNSKSLLGAILNTITGSNAPVADGHTRSSLVPTVGLVEGQCQQIAYECSSYEHYLLGLCSDCGLNNEKCFEMGFPFQYMSHQTGKQVEIKQPKRMFLVMGDNARFCSSQYQLVAHLGRSMNRKRAQGKVQVEYQVFEGRAEKREIDFEAAIDGRTLTTLIPIDHKAAMITGILFTSLSSSIQIERIELKYLSSIDVDIKARYSGRLCSKGERFVECDTK